MDDRQKQRIERYLMNASRFLWGLCHGRNQKETYRWLERKGYKFTRARYGLVVQQLLLYPGLEGILKDIVIPIVEDSFPEATLNILREHWYRGELPSLSGLKNLIVRGNDTAGPDQAFHWRPFIEIDTQFHYVRRWGEFAGVWFEEIEDILRDRTRGRAE